MDSLPTGPPSTETHPSEYHSMPSIGSETTDDDDMVTKKGRTSMDDESVNDECDETDPRNIWKKRRKYSLFMQTEITNVKGGALTELASDQPSPRPSRQQPAVTCTPLESIQYSDQAHCPRRPHDHQVPNFIPAYPPDESCMSMGNRLVDTMGLAFVDRARCSFKIDIIGSTFAAEEANVDRSSGFYVRTNASNVVVVDQ
jgi:hypothetical protein